MDATRQKRCGHTAHAPADT
ncbi:uncharacterized protein G2W53_009317 [Senna tora]|uniref:Uncharacterized protein n=1 Tax=Senna tora TaxID=362788 RepID=A0A834WXL2_9FABA|nr:uncharacterized protein G2W53_009317 [Senna tora]